MDAEEFIAQHGAALSESEKRYIRAFGAPQMSEQPSRRPSTASQRVGAAASVELTAEEREREARLRATEASLGPLQQMMNEEREAVTAEEERAARDVLEEEEAAEWGLL